MQPPDMAVVPPTTGAFSSTSTRAPFTAPASAALSPAAPVPTTTISNAVFVIPAHRIHLPLTVLPVASGTLTYLNSSEQGSKSCGTDRRDEDDHHGRLSSEFGQYPDI